MPAIHEAPYIAVSATASSEADAQADIVSSAQNDVQARVVYLNDDYEGGETEFPELGISHKGRAGEGLYFVNTLDNNEPDLRTVHAGRPPTRGEKWIVSQFVRGRRVLGAANATAAPSRSH